MITAITHPVTTYTEHRVVMSITATESLPIAPGTGRFFPEGIIIIYGKSGKESWRLISVEVHGPKLKTGGVRSAITGKCFWYLPGKEVPAWLQTIIDTYMPQEDSWLS